MKLTNTFRPFGLRLLALTLLCCGTLSTAFAQTCATPTALTADAVSTGEVTLCWEVANDGVDAEDSQWTISVGGTGLNCDNAASAAVKTLYVASGDADVTGSEVCYTFNGFDNNLTCNTSYTFIVTQTCPFMVMDGTGDNTSGCAGGNDDHDDDDDSDSDFVVFKIPASPFTVEKEITPPTCFADESDGEGSAIAVTVTDGTDDCLCIGDYTIELSTDADGVLETFTGGEDTYTFEGYPVGDYTVTVTEVGGCFYGEEDDANVFEMDVEIVDPLEEPDATIFVAELFGMQLNPEGGDIDLGEIILPPGTCSMTMYYTLFAESDCRVVCDLSRFNIATFPYPDFIQAGITAEDEEACDYLLTLKLVPGTNTIEISGTDLTTLTITANVIDTTIPVVSVSSGLNFTIPACTQSITRNLVVQVDDACAFGLFNLEGAIGSLGGVDITADDIVSIDPIQGTVIISVDLTIANDGDLLQLAVVDESGNIGVFEAPISVQNAVEDADPIIIAADATVFVPACVPGIPFTYSLQVIDDCDPFDADLFGVSIVPEAALAALDVDVMDNGMVRVTSESLPAGTYTITYSYGEVEKTVVVQANSVENEAPEIIVPGNQTVTLPACVGGSQGGEEVVINGFVDIFAPENWTTSVGTGATLDFTTEQMTLTSGAGTDASTDVTASYVFPQDGQISFDYYIEQENSIIEDIIIIDLEGNVIVQLETTPAGNPFIVEDSADEAVEAGWTILFSIDGDGFATGGVTSLMEITNWTFTTAGGGGGDDSGVLTSWAFQISDDCSDIVEENLIITVGGVEVPFTLNGGIAVITPSISLAANGARVEATYTDGTLSTTAGFNITVLQADDTQPPVVVYPSQNINLVLDACDAGFATQIFQVTTFDNCGVDEVSVTASGGSLINLPNSSTYIFSGAGDEDGETYTISITATDVNGNVTNESFVITVQQDDAEEFSVACQGSISVSLNDNCEAVITPQMVLSGEFGCVDPAVDLKITVLDGDQSNGNVVDGCGDFMYRVEPVVTDLLTVEGFEGPFAPSNWVLEDRDETLPPGDETFVGFIDGGNTLLLETFAASTGFLFDVFAYVELPVDGTVSFDYFFPNPDNLGNPATFGFDAYYIGFDDNGDLTFTILETDDVLTEGSFTIENANAGGLVIFLLEDDGFAPIFNDEPTQLFISNWFFQEDGIAVNPLLNGFQGCMGMVSSKDLTAPEVDAPADTDVNAGNNFALYCDQTDDLSVVNIPLADRCYVVTAAGTNLPSNNPQSINHPSKRALRDILSVTGFPNVSDNCGMVEVCVSDAVINDDMCEDYHILRTFRVKDGVNSTCNNDNTAQDTQDITFSRPELSDLVLPTTPVELDCGASFATLPNGNPAPSATGFPTLQTGLGTINIGDGTTGAIFCNIGAAFEDGPRITTCDGSFKFVRTWTLFDWCGPNGVAVTDTYEQLIKVGDFNAPTISYNGPTMFTTNAFGCTSVFIVPTPSVSDNCSSAVTTVAYVYAFGDLDSAPFGPYNVGSITDALPKGTHTLQYASTDVCGNESRLNVDIMIADKTAPVAKCDDDFNASLGGTGEAWFSAEEIDAGSYDECTDVRLEVRRSIANFETAPGPGAGPNPTNPNLFTAWAPTVSFDCDDADRYVRVELRVWDDGNMNGIIGDAGDNSNTCWLDLLIENKLPPVCVAPAPVTVLCTDLDPNFPNDLQAAYDADPDGVATLLGDAFGYAVATGNCGAEVVELRPIDGRDDCGFGTITRRFEASAGTSTSAGSLTSSCNQTIIVEEVHEYDIKFPMDDEFDCNIDPVGPTVETYEIGCDLLSIYRDTMRFQATGDECYKLRKTIQIINWCEYDGIGDPYVLSRDEDNDGIAGEMFWVAVEGDRAFVRRNRETGLLREIAGYANSSSRGYFEYVQFLKVYDNVAPTIDVVTEELEFCSIAATCDAPVTIEFTVDDACTPDQTQMLVAVALDAFVVDANGDGTISLAEFTADQPLTVTGNGTLSVSGTFPIGRHAIRIAVEDGCGNYAAQIVVFEVVDCKAPAPICINGLTVTLMPDGNGGGMMGIWASDYLASPIDDCSGIVGYAIYKTEDVIAEGDDFVADPEDTGLDLTCDDLGMVSVRVYAIDGAGNFDYCETSLLVQANTPGLCAGVGSIAGVIATQANESVEGVEVSLTGNNAMSFTTGENGAFVFEDLALDMDYTVTPYLDNNHKNGVSTFDLVLIQKHILGTQPLDSPYKRIAADATNDENVTTLDLIHLRRLILNITTELPNNTSWRFVEADYEFSNPSNPWAEDFPEIFNANDLAGDISANFIAVKIGDVNFSAVANAQSAGEARGVGYFNFEVADAKLLAGNVYTVEFTGSDLAELAGFQGTLQLTEGVELVDVVYGVATEEHFGMTAVDRGAITFSWNGEATSQDVLFSLVVRANADADLSEVLSVTDRYTAAEAYTLGGAKRNVGIAFATGEVTAAGFELYQNRPNPVAGETTIGFNLPSAGVVTLTIQDVTGRVILNRTEERAAGYNNLVLNRRELGVSGVLTYTVTAGDYTATKKMVVVD